MSSLIPAAVRHKQVVIMLVPEAMSRTAFRAE
jgi:hypothetical protein